MHRPFALAPCGHSACYQCLVNWFKAPPADVPPNEVYPTWLRKKTCPHCRTVVKERPIEIWAIKEMVASLVKSGLAQAFYTPAPEPAEGAAANADPWAGIFRAARGNQDVFPDEPYLAPLQQLMGIRDDEDGGIWRCIDCHHEIWEGVCTQCGREYPGHDPENDLDDDDDDSVRDIWRDQAEQAWGDEDALDLHEGIAFIQHLRDAFGMAPDPRFDYHLDMEDDDSLDMDGHDSDSASDDGDSVQGIWGRGLRRGAQPAAHARLEDEDEHDGSAGEEDGYESSFIDDGGDDRYARGGPHDDDPIELSDEESEDHEEDDGGVHFVGFGARRPPVVRRGRGAIVISDDEDDHSYQLDDDRGEHDDDEDDEEQ